MNVWMSTKRRGLSYHLIRESARYTECGRYIGRPRERDYPHAGHVLPLVRAVDDYAARVCKACAGDAERVAPDCAPSRDRVA